MVLNQYSVIVADTYQWLCDRYSYLYSDEWIIMPNHFHAIMVIADRPRMDTDKPCRGRSHCKGGSRLRSAKVRSWEFPP